MHSWGLLATTEYSADPMSRLFVVVRHLVKIVVLPATVVVLIPLWIVDRYELRFAWPGTSGNLALVLLGCGLLVVGGTLFVASVRRFAGEGQGRSRRGTHRAGLLSWD